MGASTWDDTTGQGADTSWKPVPTEGAGDWQPDGDASYSGGNFKDENVSKHDDAGFEGAPQDGGCRVCGSDAHFARDCPDKPADFGACFNCGEQGHNKANCTNPRVEREFTGTCRVCSMQGHRAADCPDKPPAACKACGNEGHEASECPVNRAYLHSMLKDLPEASPEDAWAALETADKEKDLDDIKKALFTYTKSFPAATFEELENTFRDADMNTHLIATEKEIGDTFTIVNLQGKADQKYVVSFQFSAKPRRAKGAEGWPETPEENMVRLAEAGFVMDGLVTKCFRCNELGHTSSSCTEEKQEQVKLVPTCLHCSVEGHYARDCPEPRRKFQNGCRICQGDHKAADCPDRVPDLCRDCNQEGHRAKDCVNERVIKCHNCDEEGHISKECTKPKDMSRVKCRNCDEVGHDSRGCPLPTDWSRVECTICHEKGHSHRRCPNPNGVAAGGDGNGGDAGGDGDWGADAGSGGKGGGDGGWGGPAPAASGGDDW